MMIIYHYNVKNCLMIFFYILQKLQSLNARLGLFHTDWPNAPGSWLRWDQAQVFLVFILLGSISSCFSNWIHVACKNKTQNINIWKKCDLICALFQDKLRYFETPKGINIAEKNAVEDNKLKDAKFMKLEKKAKKIGARVVMIEDESEEEEETMTMNIQDM